MIKLHHIEYRHQNIGFFPGFSKNHGFSWGKDAGNMSFSYGEKTEVFPRITNFLNNLEMGSVIESISITPEHSDRIIDLDYPTVSKIKPSRVGRILNCDAVFLLDKDISVTIKVGDCQTFYISGITDKGKKVLGLVHAGWVGVSIELPRKAIEHAINNLGARKESLKVFMVPTIKKGHRTMEHFDRVNGEIENWGDFIQKDGELYHVDSFGFAINQMKEAGIKDENITVYDIDNYEAAKDGFSFSREFYVDEERKGSACVQGRFIVALRS